MLYVSHEAVSELAAKRPISIIGTPSAISKAAVIEGAKGGCNEMKATLRLSDGDTETSGHSRTPNEDGGRAR